MTSERKFIAENIRRVLLKEYFMSKTERAGFGGLKIMRTPVGTRVTLVAERPGMVIGRKGATIKALTQTVESEFKFENPQIEVQESDDPNLNAQIMAQKLASALERGWHFRRAGHSTVRRIMQAGAKGCQVTLSGKLTGQRHRTEKFKEGHIKYCGEPALQWMDLGFATAKKKLGTIGVKVMIMDPNAKLPDEVTVAERAVAYEAPPIQATTAQVEAAKAAAAESGEATEEEAPVEEVKEEAPVEQTPEETPTEEAPAEEPKEEPPAEEKTDDKPDTAEETADK